MTVDLTELLQGATLQRNTKSLSTMEASGDPMLTSSHMADEYEELVLSQAAEMILSGSLIDVNGGLDLTDIDLTHAAELLPETENEAEAMEIDILINDMNDVIESDDNVSGGNSDVKDAIFPILDTKDTYVTEGNISPDGACSESALAIPLTALAAALDNSPSTYDTESLVKKQQCRSKGKPGRPKNIRRNSNKTTKAKKDQVNTTRVDSIMETDSSQGSDSNTSTDFTPSQRFPTILGELMSRKPLLPSRIQLATLQDQVKSAISIPSSAHSLSEQTKKRSRSLTIKCSRLQKLDSKETLNTSEPSVRPKSELIVSYQDLPKRKVSPADALKTSILPPVPSQIQCEAPVLTQLVRDTGKRHLAVKAQSTLAGSLVKEHISIVSPVLTVSQIKELRLGQTSTNVQVISPEKNEAPGLASETLQAQKPDLYEQSIPSPTICQPAVSSTSHCSSVIKVEPVYVPPTPVMELLESVPETITVKEEDISDSECESDDSGETCSSGSQCKTPEEESERLERRRYNNRVAAQRCRQRKRHHFYGLKKEIQEWECSNTRLRYEIHVLRKELKLLSGIWKDHTAKCSSNDLSNKKGKHKHNHHHHHHGHKKNRKTRALKADVVQTPIAVA